MIAGTASGRSLASPLAQACRNHPNSLQAVAVGPARPPTSGLCPEPRSWERSKARQGSPRRLKGAENRGRQEVTNAKPGTVPDHPSQCLQHERSAAAVNRIYSLIERL